MIPYIGGKKKMQSWIIPNINKDIEIFFRNHDPIIECSECTKNAGFYLLDEPLCKKCLDKKSDEDK